MLRNPSTQNLRNAILFVEAKQEFKELLKQSGWNQAEAARRLELTPASISRYMSEQDEPSKQTLRLFRLLLNATPMGLQDTGPAYTVNETLLWRRRALAAEQELADLHNAMRGLLTRRMPAAAPAKSQPDNPPSEFQEQTARAAKKALSKP